jgi:biotin transport system substrate-specific component
MALVAVFSALTAMGAWISLPLGPVPITMQSLFVLLSGIVLGAKLGALSQLLYIFLGLIGLPIFAGFTGGVQSIMKPSFGFIIGFVFAGFIVGKIVNSNKNPSTIRIVFASCIGSLTIYLFGLPYMYYTLNVIIGQKLSFSSVFNMGCLIFLPGDFLKFILASILGKRLLQSSIISRQAMV